MAGSSGPGTRRGPLTRQAWSSPPSSGRLALRGRESRPKNQAAIPPLPDFAAAPKQPGRALAIKNHANGNGGRLPTVTASLAVAGPVPPEPPLGAVTAP